MSQPDFDLDAAVRRFTTNVIARAHDVPLTAVHMQVTESYCRLTDGPHRAA